MRWFCVLLVPLCMGRFAPSEASERSKPPSEGTSAWLKQRISELETIKASLADDAVMAFLVTKRHEKLGSMPNGSSLPDIDVLEERRKWVAQKGDYVKSMDLVLPLYRQILQSTYTHGLSRRDVKKLVTRIGTIYRHVLRSGEQPNAAPQQIQKLFQRKHDQVVRRYRRR